MSQLCGQTILQGGGNKKQLFQKTAKWLKKSASSINWPTANIENSVFFSIKKKCELISCEARSCDLRHPKPCVFVLQNKPCKFDKLFSFDHKLEASVNNQKESSIILNEQIIELQNLLEKKDAEINTLEEKLKEIEINQKFNQNDSDLDSVSTSSEAEALDTAVTSEESSDEE